MAKHPGWCGECYSNCRGRSNFRGHFGYRERASRRLPLMALFRRPQVGPAGPDLSRPEPCCNVSKRLPDLHAFLTHGSWPDGAPRERGNILVLYQDGCFKACLNDKDAVCSCWISAPDFHQLLERANKVLGGDGGDWRAPRPPLKRK